MTAMRHETRRSTAHGKGITTRWLWVGGAYPPRLKRRSTIKQ